ncbi:MAG: UbiX family flavin prenyltransferase [Thermodesulfobacteriota bacterium]
MKDKIIVAITGASGMMYAKELLAILDGTDVEIHAIISEAGEQVLKLELGMQKSDFPRVRWWDIKQFTAPMASGSARFQAMAVVPCTMGTLAAIASGLSTNLIHRAADVMLKERRKVVLSVRETPFNRTHLQNMLAVHDAGATICPAMPSMYQKPQSIEEMARNYASRVVETLGLEVDYPRWQGE